MSKPTLEERIGQWRNYLEKWPAVRPADIDELEDHLRSQIEALRQAGLDEDEAFLVAVKRLGDLDAISREFTIKYSERLWKQQVVISGSATALLSSYRDTRLAVGLVIASALAIKIPVLFGFHLSLAGLLTLLFICPISVSLCFRFWLFSLD